MKKEGVNLNIVSKKSDGKISEQLITNANPDVSDELLKKFAVAFAGLSDDTLESVQRIQTDDLL